jgi:hypothetical protein
MRPQTLYLYTWRATTAALRLSPEQIKDVKRIQQDLREGREVLASDAEMAALWRKCGL